MQVTQWIRKGAEDTWRMFKQSLSVSCASQRILRATCISAIFLTSCTSPEEKGQTLFNQNCASCHNFSTNGIGPHLGGVTERLSEEQIKQLLKDPKGAMPSFKQMSDDDVDAIIAYLKTKPAPVRKEFKPDGSELKDPVPAKIQMSNIVADLQLVTTIPPSSNEEPKTRINKLDYRADTKDLFVLDLRGKLYQLTSKGPEGYLDMAKKMLKFIDKPGLGTGFGSFAFHPDFARNHLLYTTHTEGAGSGIADFAYADSIKVTLQWVLLEWNMDKKESRELFRANMVNQIHGVQEITFDPLAKPGDEDYSLLYIGVGDGGAVENRYPFLAHNKNNIWGSVLRIDPQGNNSRNKKYGIPKSNPFGNEIFTYGFRNPHRISWTKKGEIIVSNVGHRNIESIYLVKAGQDHGWPEREGSFELRYKESMDFVYKLPANDSAYSYPIAQYDHDEGNAISGGFEYKGKYLFGDIVNGRLFFIELNDQPATIKEFQLTLDGKKTSLKEQTGLARIDLRFGRDRAGEIYILTKADGRIYKIKTIK